LIEESDEESSSSGSSEDSSVENEESKSGSDSGGGEFSKLDRSKPIKAASEPREQNDLERSKAFVGMKRLKTK
jgi:hypothetical protein